ncbi:transposase [Aequorivita capsosiphonis]|uniref:transposase n=1 Tax=Aequorivita capsosiphonis TaxID=487317 RepID=UPI000406ADD4|nr:transposase [Aequorivita capsosiphonis]
MKQDFIELGATYHIFNRGNNRENIFIEDKNYTYFLQLLKKHIIPIADIYAYCLLKNHFHLLLRIKDENDISIRYKDRPYQPFSNMFNAYSKAINKAYSRSGSLFQEHLKRKRIKDEKYLTQVLGYIHLNPVKHGFTQDFKTYIYSSFKAYSSNKHSNIDSETIFELIDKESFEYWHHQSVMGLEDIMDL